MNRHRAALQVIIAGTFLAASIVLADQKGILRRVLPKKEPQVLKNIATKAPVQPHPDAINLQNSFAQVAEAVGPAVVNISAVQIQKVQADPHQFFYGDPNEFFYRFFGEAPPGRPTPRQPEREFRTEGTGSGVIIDPDGYILTNNHVVQGADQLTVTLGSGKTLKGTVVGTDPRTDLAVIRIKGSTPFAFVPLGDSSKMRIGDWVLALGSPFGLEQTVTAGIVSAIRQSLNIEGRTFANLLQTDAAINRGNSGGPLVNIHGEVIGINTAIYAPTGVFSGIGFAIPVNEAKKILQDLIKKGFVERSWIGVEIAEIDEVMAQQFGLKTAQGALINQIVPKSPAEKAGLQRGDVIVSINGKPIKNVSQLQEIVGNTKPKSTLRIKAIRNSTAKEFTLVTDLMPTQTVTGTEREPVERTPGKPSTGEWLGATFADATVDLKSQFGITDAAEGVLVIMVPANSTAAEAGLAEGDIIRAVNRQKIDSVKTLKTLSSKLDPKKGLLFDVVRRGRSFYLSFKSLQ